MLCALWRDRGEEKDTPTRLQLCEAYHTEHLGPCGCRELNNSILNGVKPSKIKYGFLKFCARIETGYNFKVPIIRKSNCKFWKDSIYRPNCVTLSVFFLSY